MSQAIVRSRWKTALILLAAANAIALCLQPVLAALFLNGVYSAFEIHGLGARAAAVLAVSCSIAAILAGQQRVAPKWLSLAFFLQFLLVVLQIYFGEVAFRQAHFPLGVLLPVGGLVLAGFSWRPAASQAGEGRRIGT